MPDTVIVTIRSGRDEADFELPAKLPFGQWAESLGNTLRQSFYGIRLEGKTISLQWQNRTIPEEATLEQCGIYDGSILMLQLEG
jgi:uncharacterized ubiquitin-like protein YukD